MEQCDNNSFCSENSNFLSDYSNLIEVGIESEEMTLEYPFHSQVWFYVGIIILIRNETMWQ